MRREPVSGMTGVVRRDPAETMCYRDWVTIKLSTLEASHGTNRRTYPCRRRWLRCFES